MDHITANMSEYDSLSARRHRSGFIHRLSAVTGVAVGAGLRWFTSTLVNRPGAAGRISWRTPFPFCEQAPARKPRSFTGDFPHRYLQLGQPASSECVWRVVSRQPSHSITAHHFTSHPVFSLLPSLPVRRPSCFLHTFVLSGSCQRYSRGFPGIVLEGGGVSAKCTHTHSLYSPQGMQTVI